MPARSARAGWARSFDGDAVVLRIEEDYPPGSDAAAGNEVDGGATARRPLEPAAIDEIRLVALAPRDQALRRVDEAAAIGREVVGRRENAAETGRLLADEDISGGGVGRGRRRGRQHVERDPFRIEAVDDAVLAGAGGISLPHQIRRSAMAGSAIEGRDAGPPARRLLDQHALME